MDRYDMNDKIMKVVAIVKAEFPNGCDHNCSGCVLNNTNNDAHYEKVCAMLDSLVPCDK